MKIKVLTELLILDEIDVEDEQFFNNYRIAMTIAPGVYTMEEIKRYVDYAIAHKPIPRPVPKPAPKPPKPIRKPIPSKPVA